MNADPPKDYPDGWQWVIFSDAGKASLSHGENITKAVANWKKANGSGGKRGDPVGVIRCGYTDSLPSALRGTDVFGVICCVHRPDATED